MIIIDSDRVLLCQQMHTDMGDERGIRLRCISLGDAALRGSRMSASGPDATKSRHLGLPDPLSIARSSAFAYKQIETFFRNQATKLPSLLSWTYLILTYKLSHSRGTPLSHLHFPVGQLRSSVA